MRADGRANTEIRPSGCTIDINAYAEGSCLFHMGRTRVHCTASVSEDVPAWRKATGQGWVTADYRMLPRATHTRSEREGDALKGRTAEIQRLIGRGLRAGVNLKALGPRIIQVDCDVLQADGGTRTAAVNGGFIALARALSKLQAAGAIGADVLVSPVCAVSVGIVGGLAMVDLPYEEDARAEVDLNVIMAGDGRLIEVQGTAEGAAFTRHQLDQMLDLAEGVRGRLLAIARDAVPGLTGW